MARNCTCAEGQPSRRATCKLGRRSCHSRRRRYRQRDLHNSSLGPTSRTQRTAQPDTCQYRTELQLGTASPLGKLTPDCPRCRPQRHHRRSRHCLQQRWRCLPHHCSRHCLHHCWRCLRRPCQRLRSCRRFQRSPPRCSPCPRRTCRLRALLRRLRLDRGALRETRSCSRFRFVLIRQRRLVRLNHRRLCRRSACHLRPRRQRSCRSQKTVANRPTRTRLAKPPRARPANLEC